MKNTRREKDLSLVASNILSCNAFRLSGLSNSGSLCMPKYIANRYLENKLETGEEGKGEVQHNWRYNHSYRYICKYLVWGWSSCSVDERKLGITCVNNENSLTEVFPPEYVAILKHTNRSSALCRSSFMSFLCQETVNDCNNVWRAVFIVIRWIPNFSVFCEKR